MIFDSREIEILQIVNLLKQSEARRDPEKRTPEQNERYLRYLEGKEDAYNEILCNYGNFETLMASCNYAPFKDEAMQVLRERSEKIEDLNEE